MRRRILLIALLLVAGVMVNAAVMVLIVLLLARDVGRTDRESVTFCEDIAGVVRWKTSVTETPTLTMAWSMRERWPPRAHAETDLGVAELPLWASDLKTPLVEFVDSRLRLEERGLVGRGWPCVTASLQILNARLSVEGFRRVNERFQVRHAIDLGDPWNGPMMPRAIPCRPVWTGFAINTIFYAVILWAIFFTPGRIRRAIRRRRGRCVTCNYDLRGRPASSSACPECGAAIPGAQGCSHG